MQRLFATTLLFASMSAMAVSPNSIQTPESYGNTFVSDTADIINDANEKELDDALVKYYKTTGVQVAVVTTPDTDGSDSPRTFANKLFERLELGDPELDNGLLMLLSVGDRRIEFETGYGLEGLLPDVTQFRIQQKYMIPYFKEGDYQQGLLDGTYATLLELDAATKQEAAAAPPSTLMTDDARPAQAKSVNESSDSNLFSMLFGLFSLGIGGIGLFLLLRANRIKSHHQSAMLLDKTKADDKPASKKLPCVYCHETSINPDSPFEDTYTTNGKKHQHNYCHLTNYEKGLIAHNIADVKLKSCPECRYTNKITTFKKSLMFCPICLEKSRYDLTSSKFLLSNSLNVYVDAPAIALTRTLPLQNKTFKKTKDDWQKRTYTHLTVTHCFLCDLMVGEVEHDRIATPPKPKPEPTPEPRHVNVSKSSSSSSSSGYSNKSSSRSKSSSFGFGGSSGSGSRSSSSSRPKPRKPTPRKRGGKSGGGGAGSSW